MRYLSARLPGLLVNAAAVQMLIVLVLVSGVWRSDLSFAQSVPSATVGQIEATAAHVQDMNRRLTRVEKWLDESHPDARIEGMIARMDGLDKRFDGIDKRLDGFEHIGYGIFVAVLAQLIASGIQWHRRSS